MHSFQVDVFITHFCFLFVIKIAVAGVYMIKKNYMSIIYLFKLTCNMSTNPNYSCQHVNKSELFMSTCQQIRIIHVNMSTNPNYSCQHVKMLHNYFLLDVQTALISIDRSIVYNCASNLWVACSNLAPVLLFYLFC